MSGGREQNGRFAMGNRANPNGRPRKSRSVNDTILREIKAPVTVTENNGDAGSASSRRMPNRSPTSARVAISKQPS